jgi:hypothetical protein
MAIALVNTANAANYGGSASTIAAPATSLTAGNLIVTATRSNSGTLNTVTDTASNTYTRIITFPTGSGTVMDIWYAKNVSGNGSNVVTSTFSGNVTGRAICTLQYSGLSTTAPYNALAYGQSSNATSVTTLPYTSNVPNSVVILFCNIDDQTGSWTTPSGFTNEVASTNNVYIVFDKIVSALQTVQTTTVTHSNASSKAVIPVVFSETAAAGGSGGQWAYV